MLNEKMVALGTQRSVIRELFEYGKQRAAEVGAENVFDFSIGNPSVPAPDCVNETAIKLLKEMDSVILHGYTSAQGDAGVRKMIADSLNSRFQTSFTADNLYMTVGAAAALCCCLNGLACPGDEFIVFAPYFPEYKVFIEATGASMKLIPADIEAFQIDFKAFEEAINEHTKGVLVNSPNNPSGAVYSEETIKKLAEILEVKSAEYHHPIYLIADEPYREIVFAGVEAPYVSKFYDNTLSCYSYSKSLSLPGERIGYVAVNPRCTDAELISAICAQISRGIGHNCPSSIIQLAVSEVVDMTSDMSVYETNMNLLYNELTSLGFECVKPGGTFYIFPKALEEDATAFSQKALKYDLVLVPSDSFGVPGYFRMAYCIDTEKVERSLTALRRFVKENY